MSTRRRVFSAQGVTNTLVDGQTRNVTLVAVVTNEDLKKETTDTSTKREGKKTIITTVLDDAIIGVKTTISFGLAVVSPIDVELQRLAVENYDRASKAKDKVGMAVASKHLNLVSEARGIEIAVGKASKTKSALTTIVNTEQFFNHGLVKLILADKLKHICQDPDRFIRIAPLRGEGELNFPKPNDKLIRAQIGFKQHHHISQAE